MSKQADCLTAEFKTFSDSNKMFKISDVIKNGLNHLGYLNSIRVDAQHGFIRRFVITQLNIYDSQRFPMLLYPKNHADFVG